MKIGLEIKPTSSTVGTHQEFHLYKALHGRSVMKIASFERAAGHVVGPWASFHWGIRKLDISRFKIVLFDENRPRNKTDKLDIRYPPRIPIVQSITCSVRDEDCLV